MKIAVPSRTIKLEEHIYFLVSARQTGTAQDGKRIMTLNREAIYGSCFAISDDLLMTAKHVVDGASDLCVAQEVPGVASFDMYATTVVATWDAIDLRLANLSDGLSA